MAKKKLSYWDRRWLDEVNLLYSKTDAAVSRRLSELYAVAAAQVIREMTDLYKDLLIEIGSGEVKANDLYRYDRYYKLLGNIRQKLTALGMKSIPVISDALVQMYAETTALLNGELFPGSAEPNEAAIRTIVDRVWCSDGKSWSKRIWDDKKLLVSSLERGLFNCVALGKSHMQLTDTLMKSFGESFRNAERLTRTELCHVQTTATFDRFEKAGYTEYNIVDAGDWPGSGVHPERECEACHELARSGPYKMSEAKVGVNLPPIHPNCRCVITPVIESRQGSFLIE